MAGRSPYGQACLGCFKTKCKCIPRPDGNGCERSVWAAFRLQHSSCLPILTCGPSLTQLHRCHRLKRPCNPADVSRRRSDKKQNSPDARIAKLEGTLGQLVSLLQAGNINVGTMNNVHIDRVNV